ncbi:MAG: 3-phosphoshikimate 1-carboxyvinyltransferase, partial [Oscillospiraceae bacterium]|nr:3-phosphoshikimate 1-carboxyvinyltransferase [Oscillospiraceae bacterium]
VSSCNDHRIAMSAAVASIACTGSVTVDGAEAVGKSYPAFWDDFESLGGCITREE